jgi:quercetin dioxygenase-like cupin family protein
MADLYTYIPGVLKEVPVPEAGILSRTLHNDERSKIVAFAFSAGQELSAHTAPMPAILQIVKGQAKLRLGEDHIEVDEGAVVHMTAQLEHGVLATTDLVMLLVLLKGG